MGMLKYTLAADKTARLWVVAPKQPWAAMLTKGKAEGTVQRDWLKVARGVNPAYLAANVPQSEQWQVIIADTSMATIEIGGLPTGTYANPRLYIGIEDGKPFGLSREQALDRVAPLPQATEAGQDVDFDMPF